MNEMPPTRPLRRAGTITPVAYREHLRGSGPQQDMPRTTDAAGVYVSMSNGSASTGSRAPVDGSRRRFLAGVAGGSALTLAGCLGLWGDDDDEDGVDEDDPDDEDLELGGDDADRFRDWVIPDNPIHDPEGAQLVCRYENLEAASETGWAPLVNHRNNTADALGVDAESVTGELRVGAPAGSGLGEVGIILGDFDVDTIVDFFQDPGGREVTGEYRDYTIFDEIAAVGADGILETPLYEDYIDANVGEGERLEEAESDFEVLFDVLPSGLLSQIFRRHDEDDLAVSARTHVEVADDDPVRNIETFVFEDADDASTERGRELLEELTGFDGVVTEEREGRVVMIEYDID